MVAANELIVIVERILDGCQDQEDITLLRQWIGAGNEPNVVQLGKYNVNIGQGQDIQIGDRIFQGPDAEAIKEAVRAVLQEQTHRSNITPRRRLGNSPQIALTSALVLPSVSFAFEVVTINSKGQELQRKQAYAQQYIEDLERGINLEMVAIPGGCFLMGSPETEPGHSPTEVPQHQVTVPEFWMSKYPVTQAQWKAVAALPQVNRSLKPKPSKFKGSNLPVEGVCWYDAVEFCDRLALNTGRPYRLPSEAKWEYACRATTNTPFHFGKMLSFELANYGGTLANGLDKRSKPQGRTTPVGSYEAANAFGLYDMHGNVWEWCLDCWHDNYNSVPTDGSAKTNGGENHPRVTRGGSWFDSPSSCCSASRASDDPEIGGSTIGFRVVFSLT